MSTKTEVKHTPGPWKVSDGGRSFGITIRNEEDAILADVHDRLDGVNNAERYVEALANAALIAAAPELLEAAKQAFEWIAAQDYNTQMRNADWRNALKVAIA